MRCLIYLFIFARRHKIGLFPSVASGLGRLFNGAHAPADATVGVRRVLVDGKIYLVMFALRDIAVGEELIWWYGADYVLPPK